MLGLRAYRFFVSPADFLRMTKGSAQNDEEGHSEWWRGVLAKKCGQGGGVKERREACSSARNGLG